MTSTAATPDQYIASLPEERREPMSALRRSLSEHLPDGFEETMSYGIIGFVVPKTLYPKGYHCDSKLPLPFIAIGSQKNYIVLHHLGIYGSTTLLDWLLEEWPKHSKLKLDMGKGCIRFKKLKAIPFDLITQLAAKMTPEEWIKNYESAFRSKKP